MELLVLRPDEFRQLYSCNYTVALDLMGDHKLLSAIYVVVAVILLLLYIPCLLAILKAKLIEQSCYKIMFTLGLLDIVGLILSGPISGVFGFFKFHFCTAPTLFYLIGIINEGLWHAQTSLSILLAVNRCLVMTNKASTDLLFNGSKTWLWICLPMLYGLYVLLFCHPILFSPITMTWVFNPHIGVYGDPDGEYISFLPIFNNFFVVAVIPIIYLAFLIVHWYQQSKIAQKLQTNKNAKKQNAIFLQVFLICVSTMAICSVYVAMQYVIFPTEVYHLAHSIWIVYIGIPPIVYLTLNKRIRHSAFSMFTSSYESSSQSTAPSAIPPPAFTNRITVIKVV